MGFNYTFGGQLVEPAYVSYITFQFPLATLTPNQLQMNWATSFTDSNFVMAQIMDINTSAGGQSMVLPPANQVSNGQQVLINNVGPNPLTIFANDGVTVIQVIPNGAPNAPTSYFIYLVDNTVTNIVGGVTFFIGAWRTVPFAGGVAAVTFVNAVPAAGITATNLAITGVPIINAGTMVFTFQGDLQALLNLAGTGYLVRAGVGVWDFRTFQVGSANLTLVNGSGVVGNTVYDLSQNIIITSAQIGNIGIGLLGNPNIINATNANGNIQISPQTGGAVQIANYLAAGPVPLLLYAGDTATNFTSFESPVGLAADINYILPALQGAAGTFLQNNGAGVLTWAAAGGGGGGVTIPTTPQFIAIFTNNTGNIAGTNANSFQIPPGDGAANNVMITNGARQLSLVPVNNILPTSLQGENLIINGDMQVWQRGAGGAAVIAVGAGTTTYTADRWQLMANANQASTVTQTAGATSGTFLAAVQRNNAEIGLGVMRFCTSLTRSMCIGSAGSAVTLQFKAQAGANFSSAGSMLTYTVYSGTGNTDTSGINGGFAGSAVAVTGAVVIGPVLTQFTATTPVLAANVTQLAIEFSYTPVGAAGVADTFLITDVQIELGTTATNFQRLNFFESLYLCLPFYQKSFIYSNAPAENIGTGTGEFIFPATRAGAARSEGGVFFGTLMRIAPTTLILYSPSDASHQVFDVDPGAGVCTASAFTNNVSGKFFLITCTGNAGTMVGDRMSVHWTADADVT